MHRGESHITVCDIRRFSPWKFSFSESPQKVINNSCHYFLHDYFKYINMYTTLSENQPRRSVPHGLIFVPSSVFSFSSLLFVFSLLSWRFACLCPDLKAQGSFTVSSLSVACWLPPSTEVLVEGPCGPCRSRERFQHCLPSFCHQRQNCWHQGNHHSTETM